MHPVPSLSGRFVASVTPLPPPILIFTLTSCYHTSAFPHLPVFTSIPVTLPSSHPLGWLVVTPRRQEKSLRAMPPAPRWSSAGTPILLPCVGVSGASHRRLEGGGFLPRHGKPSLGPLSFIPHSIPGMLGCLLYAPAPNFHTPVSLLTPFLQPRTRFPFAFTTEIIPFL